MTEDRELPSGDDKYAALKNKVRNEVSFRNFYSSGMERKGTISPSIRRAITLFRKRSEKL